MDKEAILSALRHAELFSRRKVFMVKRHQKVLGHNDLAPLAGQPVAVFAQNRGIGCSFFYPTKEEDGGLRVDKDANFVIKDVFLEPYDGKLALLPDN